MLKESELKESRKWKYIELKFDFEEKYHQISMFEGDKDGKEFCNIKRK